jgi:hypothetical protein
MVRQRLCASKEVLHAAAPTGRSGIFAKRRSGIQAMVSSLDSGHFEPHRSFPCPSRGCRPAWPQAENRERGDWGNVVHLCHRMPFFFTAGVLRRETQSLTELALKSDFAPVFGLKSASEVLSSTAQVNDSPKRCGRLNRAAVRGRKTGRTGRIESSRPRHRIGRFPIGRRPGRPRTVAALRVTRSRAEQTHGNLRRL